MDDQFLYDWNPDAPKMKNFYSTWNNVSTFDFSVTNLLREIAKDKKNGKSAVILLTASPNYNFGLSQFKFFSTHLILRSNW